VSAYEGWPDLRRTYDSVARDYAAAFAGELAAKPFDRLLLDAFAEALPARSLVADLGCGPAAQVGAYVRARGHRVVGIDLSPGCAALSPLPTAAGDLAALPLRAGSLAGIVCFYALIHLPRAVVPTVLRDLRQVLRPGGRLVVAVHAGEGELSRRGFLGHDVPFAATFFERAELHGLLAAAGYEDVRVARRAPYPDEHPTARLYATARASGGSGPARTA
jgi:SAM-dependent methyltransferase